MQLKKTWLMANALKIILADDDPDDRLLFREALESVAVAHDYHEFEDGVQLVAYLNSTNKVLKGINNTNLIFLDLNMPKLSGLQVLHEMQNHSWENIVIIIWTTGSKPEAIDECLKLGANQFITKPETFTELEHSLLSIIQLAT